MSHRHLRMYTGIAILVLFDARGEDVSSDTLVHAALLLAAFLLVCTYVPAIIYRPRLVDDMCGDVLTLVTHAIGIAMAVSDGRLMYACCLHSLCFLVQHRVLRKVQYPVLIHTVMCLTMAAAYVHGPRISDIKQFVVSAIAPHVLEMLALVTVHLHKFAVSWAASDI
jgi:hypothetical protein